MYSVLAMPCQRAGRKLTKFWTDLRSWFGRLNRTEWRRRLWHMSPGLLPIGLWFVPHADPLSPTLRVIIGAIGVLISLGIIRGYRRIARPADRARLTAVAGYAGSVLAIVICFPADLEISLVVLSVLAFGDGSATIAGKLIRGPRLPWNRDKSWAGFLTFCVIGSLAASLFYWAETFFNPESQGPPTPFPLAFLIGATTACIAAVAESWPLRVNDNIRVGFAAAITVVTLHHLLLC